MKRLTLMLACLFICGCAGRVNTNLLQARIREQAQQLTDKQREITTARSELKRSRLEAERLKSELAQSNSVEDFAGSSNSQVSKLHIYPLASGGLNKDDQPGDDAVVVQFAPLDRDHEPIKLSGDLEFVLIDPQLPDAQREIGRWAFGEEECRSHWTRGITSSGFQFSLPLEQPPQHKDLVVQLRFKGPDARRYDATQIVKVAVAPDGVARVSRPRKRPIQAVPESDEPLPPVGVPEADADLPAWAQDEDATVVATPGHTVLHSANWTDATMPRLR